MAHIDRHRGIPPLWNRRQRALFTVAKAAAWVVESIARHLGLESRRFFDWGWPVECRDEER